jgi:hypothetical protein
VTQKEEVHMNARGAPYLRLLHGLLPGAVCGFVAGLGWYQGQVKYDRARYPHVVTEPWGPWQWALFGAIVGLGVAYGLMVRRRWPAVGVWVVAVSATLTLGSLLYLLKTD